MGAMERVKTFFNSNDPEQAARYGAAAMQIRAAQKRCPECAPGYGTGLTCMHHFLSARKDLQETERKARTLILRSRMGKPVDGPALVKAVYSDTPRERFVFGKAFRYG